MKRALWLAAALGLSITTTALAQQGPVPIVGLVELSGTGTTSGTNFDNGVKLAVKEINAAGGILGRKIEYTSGDTQSNPQIAKALAQKAVDQKRLRRDGSGVLRLDHRQHGGDEDAPRSPISPAAKRRASRSRAIRTSSARRSRSRRRCPRSRATCKDDRQGEDGRDHLGQQRLRQRRPRHDGQGARRARRQGRRRHLDRSGPARLLGRRAEGQAVERRRAVRLHERGRVGARAARAAQAGLRQADRRRDDAHQPEGHRARRRRRQRRRRARRPHSRCAAAGDQGVRREIPEGIQVPRPTTTASRATARCTSSR